MSKVAVYNQTGDKIKDLELASNVFDIELKNHVVHEAFVAQRHNVRRALGHTKTKAEVRGGGRKPWKQKGTGRARQGSIRAPQWVGGGIVFGPNYDRNFSVKINKKVRRAALAMCLTDKVKENKLVVLDDLKLTGKTKELRTVLQKFNLQDKKILVSLAGKQAQVALSCRNLPKVKYLGSNSLNVGDLLNYDSILTTESGVKNMEELYSISAKKIKV